MKEVSESVIFPAFVINNDYLEYTIHFQNTGNDTAFTVLLIDTLSNYIDISTFQLVSNSHPVVVNNYDGTLWFRFNQIYLPDSNTNEMASHGYVKYRVKLNNTIALGNTINNTAYIYFDFNEPIITNTTNTLYTILSAMVSTNSQKTSVYPNPVFNQNAIVKSQYPIEQIELLDIAGKSIALYKGNASLNADLELKDLTNGVYIIKVITTQNVFEQRLIKQ
jgi:uncharacterized repeat protein (TIGR01451 family)